MSAITGPFSIISLLAEIYLLYIYVILSRKLGTVTKMKPYYRGFYVAMVLIGLAAVAHLIRLISALAPQAVPPVFNLDGFYILLYYAPLALAGTLSLAIAWRYWGWLFKERER